MFAHQGTSPGTVSSDSHPLVRENHLYIGLTDTIAAFNIQKFIEFYVISLPNFIYFFLKHGLFHENDQAENVFLFCSHQERPDQRAGTRPIFERNEN